MEPGRERASAGEELAARDAVELPNGRGKFTWPDGSVYDGDWAEGLKNGAGTYTWPSGAVYSGEWQQGRMHGQGVYEASDGTRYQGSWVNDVKSGLGSKRFPNGDEYEGLWRAGVPAGPGSYKWANGNEYNGEWVGGQFSGRGTFVWGSGERYDGEWRDGREEGRGTFTWPDGSYYDGLWQRGEKHGEGVWAPPLPKGAEPVALDEPRMAVLREYAHGQLVREEALPATKRPVGDPVAGRPAVKSRVVREVRMGETIFKGAPSYDLMLQLQLGIRWSVGRVTPEPGREVGDADFDPSHPLFATSVRFPRGGTATTPPHASHDFKFKDYCPMVFRHLREHFGIDAGDYMLSLCGDMALRELSSPGKSGSIFFLTQDGRFIVKTMRKAEMVHLRRAVLRRYYAHALQYPQSLLNRFYGLHRVKPHGGRNVRFVVMGNLLATGHTLHRRYDLKGSTFGRLTPLPYDPVKKILKDLDLEYTFALEDGNAARLIAQLAADCRLLEQLNIMDYSLLLGVHFSALPARLAEMATSEDEDDDFAGETNAQLGVNMTALAVPGRVLPAPRGVTQQPLPTERLRAVLNLGIIDILQEYNFSKRFEHSWKSLVQGQKNISSFPPKEYAERLVAFMRGVFTDAQSGDAQLGGTI